MNVAAFGSTRIMLQKNTHVATTGGNPHEQSVCYYPYAFAHRPTHSKNTWGSRGPIDVFFFHGHRLLSLVRHYKTVVLAVRFAEAQPSAHGTPQAAASFEAL
eukprot:4918891-Amphidinium_carterae.1